MRRGAAVLLLSVAVLAGMARAETAERPYLRAAIQAARWIESMAVATPHGRAWPAVPPDAKTVQSNLYSGMAGVAIFFLELGRVTGKRDDLQLAAMAADYLLDGLPAEKDMGLYTGIAGIAFALEEAYKATGQKRYREGFLAGINRITSAAVKAGRGLEWDGVTDIISGSAGIGLFLLYASQELGDASLQVAAERVGDRLIELGRPEAGGLKWAMAPDYPRLMPNFSHGTAGVAYFLAILYQRTKKNPYLQAAIRGAKYLQAVADTRDEGCLIFHDEPDGRNLYYLGWCHGPAGTARLFERLFEASGDPSWKTWMAKSARSLLRSGIPQKSTPGFWNNVGLCCGSAGVADFMLGAYRLTRDQTYLDFALRLTSDLLAKATPESNGLKWIQAEHRVRPDFLQAQTGLMQGAAGIGLWLLRLDEFFQGQKKGVVLPDDPFRN